MVDRLPHICFLAPNAYPLLVDNTNSQFAGGAELQQVIIAKGLVERGYPVSMVCLNFGQEARCEIDGITVYRAFRHSEGLPVLRFVWPRLTSVWKCLKTANADIYYQRAASVWTGVLAVFCRLHGKKSIFAVAGEPKIRFRRDRWIYQFGIRHVDRILVQNIEQERFVRERVGRDSLLVPNISHPPAHSGEIAPQNVLWVATIRQVKQPDAFLDVAQALPEYHFTMVGGRGIGESQLYDSISARAEALANVEFAGYVPYGEIGQYFDKALLFVNTSESEGFPNTFLQAWVRGVSTVSFIECGAQVDEQPVGIRVNSVDEMITAVAELVENDIERLRLGQACKAYVEKHHAPNRILDMYEGVFRRMLES